MTGNAFKNIFRIPELRDRVIFTLLALVAFRIGIFIPIPGLDLNAWQNALSGLQKSAGGGFLNFFDVFAGGALSNFSIFVLSVTPYINASIILQLLTSVIPSLKEMLKEGEQGRKKYAHYTRLLTIVLVVIQSLALSFSAINQRAQGLNPILFVLLATASVSAGSMFLLWLGEMVTEKGIGNGVSVLIFAGIVSRYPAYAYQAYIGANPLEWIILLAIYVISIVVVIAVQTSERRIKVQYAKRVMGNKVYGGASTYIPLKVNAGGVIPIIFASAILTVPAAIASMSGNAALNAWIGQGSILYIVFYAALIFFFTYFYGAIVMDPKEMSENIKNYGGFIPGIRPGESTQKYIMNTMSKVTFIGAIFLVFISVLPYLVRSASGVAVWVGGTSILIAVGVAIDILQQMDAHMIARQYEGFMKNGKLRGRR